MQVFAFLLYYYKGIAITYRKNQVLLKTEKNILAGGGKISQKSLNLPLSSNQIVSNNTI